MAEVPAALAYLRARGVLPPNPSSLQDLRAHPALKHRDADGRRSGPWPALVALVRSPGGRPVGLHVTWIDPARPGRKAPAHPPRKLFSTRHGATRGAAVRLLPPSDELAVAEGIETALAVHVLTGRPAWAALSAGGLERVVLPPEVREVLVCPDHDASGVGQRAGDRLAARLLREGRVVRVAVPPEPGDWADVARGAGEVSP